ncbi:MAG TPA: ATPase [Candidatus Aminicenantes bacterium]|nr:ATPase [Candidatus Aminicenantes bacterium]
MKTAGDLRQVLQRLNGRCYKGYQSLKGIYDLGEFVLFIDHVQADPFAPPSRIRLRISQEKAAFPAELYQVRPREIGLRDYLSRQVSQAIKKHSRGRRGTDKSGLIYIPQPGQEILERSSIIVTRNYVEARLGVGLPAYGRRIAAPQAEEIFFGEIPRIVEAALRWKNVDHQECRRHVETAEDADSLRNQLQERGLVAFIADGALLPRASGIDPRPLSRERAVLFESPPSLRVTLTVPHRGPVTGMGVPQGITLIVGGGYHGKSTLLDALAQGVYNHRPGDGREYVVTDAQAVKIRAEDGRRIEQVDISPFITNLPFGEDTSAFSTEDASGSTSQAANIIEALEAGARVLLVDEDTSATNFMIRDHRMQELVAKDKEPITPFIDKVRLLFQDYGVSTVLVLGGSGDYFDVADRVIWMVEYRPQDVTERARQIAEKYRAERRPEGGESFGRLTPRVPLPEGIDPRRGKKPVKIKADGLESIQFGYQEIDLTAVEQVVDRCQVRALGDAVYYARKYMDGQRTLRQVITKVMTDLQTHGLDVLSPFPHGEYAAFRSLELAAALNRLRTFTCRQRR